jgi:hypothetical protein
MSMSAVDLATEISDAIQTEFAGLPAAATSAQIRAALATAIADAVIAHIVERAEIDGTENLVT